MSSRSGGSGSGGYRTSRGMHEAMNMNTLQRKTMSGEILIEFVIVLHYIARYCVDAIFLSLQ